jgi:hypothetical protein
MKSGLAVVALLLLISVVIAFGLSRRYGPELTQTQDLVTGLIYFLEDHDARFPATEDEFRASAFIEKTPDGIRVLPKPGTRFRRETHGILIRDLKPFQIAWGAELTKITVDNRGKPRWPSGDEAALVSWPSSPPSSKAYTLMLLTVAEQLRGAPFGNPSATSNPTSASMPAPTP